MHRFPIFGFMADASISKEQVAFESDRPSSGIPNDIAKALPVIFMNASAGMETENFNDDNERRPLHQ